MRPLGRVSLADARRRSVGAQASHVDAPYIRSLVGDNARGRSLWGPYPRLERSMRLAVVVSITAFSWWIAIALVCALVALIGWVFS